MIDKRMNQFLRSEQGRIKRFCPNLGEFLPLLACSSISWTEIAQVFVREVFDRNVKWVIIMYPELVDLAYRPPPAPVLDDKTVELLQKLGVEEGPEAKKKAEQKALEKKQAEMSQQYANLDRGRLPKTWKATLVSNRLVMFHVMFLRMFRQDRGQDIPAHQTKLKLDRSFGRSTHRMQELFQKKIKEIKNIKDWDSYFRVLGMPPPSLTYLCDWLQQASLNSANKRYHNPQAVREALDKKRAEARKEKEAKKKKKLQLGGEFDDDDISSESRATLNSLERAEYYSGSMGKRRDYDDD